MVVLVSISSSSGSLSSLSGSEERQWIVADVVSQPPPAPFHEYTSIHTKTIVINIVIRMMMNLDQV